MSKQKQKKIEVSIERNDHSSAQFLVFEEKSNRPIFRSQIYTRRQNAITGAKRYAKREGYMISRWLK